MLSAMGVEHTIEHLTDDHLFSGEAAAHVARVGPHSRAYSSCAPIAAPVLLPPHCPLPCLASNFAPAVDIALPEERIAIEVDGPHHFTSNTFRPLGEMYCRWVAFQPGQASQMIGRIWREGGYGWVGQDGMAG